MQKPIRFYLPESEDLVDPSYDFIKDAYSPDRRPGIQDDVYAHEIFGEPQCDGILVTKSVVSPQIEERIRNAGGIHQYLRLPDRYPVMGDCGAFQYISEEEPPYTCEEIFDYYNDLRFDYGLSLDHVIVQFSLEYDGGRTLIPLEPTDAMKSRFQITLDNAREMGKLVEERDARFQLIGCVQGWSPESYHEAVRQLIDMGYDYIAIGGVAKASNEVIIPILETIRDTVKSAGVKLHMLGVARLELLKAYLETNVASCDSSAPIMQAFKSSKDNYHTPDRTYTAVRIPPVRGDASPKVRKLLNKSPEAEAVAQVESRLKHLRQQIRRGGESLSEAELSQIKQEVVDLEETHRQKIAEFGKLNDQLYDSEQEALRAVRDYDEGRVSLKRAMKSLIQYEELFGEGRKYYDEFEETLRDRPWEKCPCGICRELGVEIVLLRGNNRNRRRGFHNTYIFYRKFRNAIETLGRLGLQS